MFAVGVLALSVYAVGGILEKLTAGAASDSVAQLVSAGSGQDTAAGGQASRLSADGRYAVFQSKKDLPSLTPLHGRSDDDTWRVYGRNLQTGTLTLLSDPSADATDPQISADGRLVAYRRSTAAKDLAQASTVVVDRDVSGAGALDRTGNVKAYDLADAPNPVASSFPGLCGDDCGPRLSANGSTIVYPTVLSPVSPVLEITVSAPGSEAPHAIRGDMVDFNALGGAFYGFSPADPPVTATITTRSLIPGQEGKDLTGEPRLRDTPTNALVTGFRVEPKKCDATGACRTEVTFDPSACAAKTPYASHLSHLWTDGHTAAGQSSIALAARCQGDLNSPWCPSTPDLTEDQMAALPLRKAVFDDDHDMGNLVSLGTVQTDSPFVAMVPGRDIRGKFTYTTQDCSAIRLVDPGPAVRERAAAEGATNPTAIHNGQDLLPSDPGTFYFLVNPVAFQDEKATEGAAPSTPQTYVARAALDPNSTGNEIPMGGFSVTVRVVRQVIEMRRDTDTGPGFAPGAAVIVSRGKTEDSSSASGIVDGARPALSADGGSLVFASPGVDDGTVRNVIVRTPLGGGTAGPGTVLSDDPRTSATSPAVSADGSTIVYVRGPYPPSSGGHQQIVLSDRQGGPPKVVSTGIDGDPGNGDSSRPALSPDGRLLGFASAATDLDKTSRAKGAQLYVRSLTQEGGATRIAGLDPDADTGTPAADFDTQGGRLVLDTPDALADGDRNGQDDVYLRLVTGRLVVTPASLDFGTIDRPSTMGRGLPLTVTNAGPGPVTVTGIEPAAPFGVQGTCTGRTLYAGGTCTTVVSFTPTTAGQYSATLQVLADNGPDGQTQRAEAALHAVVEPTPTGPSPTTGPPPPTGPPSPSPSPRTTDNPSPAPSGGTGTAAQLGIAPAVAHPGRVTQARGNGFAPGAKLDVTWGTTGPVSRVTVSADGTFTAYIPVPEAAEAAETGRGSVSVSGGDGRLLAFTQFLVEEPPLQPPFFQGQ
ncbi:choice-of-anchor D domain-containing protein [Streptomyces griseofuscus]|uniref:choice-of-anchor D domain-containing protein n=1 Tax=Streptomyces griseofuscus TaxID=146922 RepID=UPI003452E937